MPQTKICYIYTDTTGLQPFKHALVQVAMIVEIDGLVEHKESWNIRPRPNDTIDAKALEVNGLTEEQIGEYMAPTLALEGMQKTLGRFIDKFDKTDKFYPAGYNVGFDIDFLRQFFVKGNDYFFGSWFNYRKIDPLPWLYFADALGAISLENYKLATVCQHFNIPLDNAHDAMADIEATRELVLGFRNLRPALVEIVNEPGVFGKPPRSDGAE